MKNEILNLAIEVGEKELAALTKKNDPSEFPRAVVIVNEMKELRRLIK